MHSTAHILGASFRSMCVCVYFFVCSLVCALVRFCTRVCVCVYVLLVYVRASGEACTIETKRPVSKRHKN